MSGEEPDRVFDPVLDVARLRRTVSPRQLAERGGPPVEHVQAIIHALGFAVDDLDRPFFTDEEAGVFVELQSLVELWPPEFQLQVSRVYGQALARIAETETYLFRTWIRGRARPDTEDPAATVAAVRDALERLLPLADPMLVGIHRRWVEWEISQLAVDALEQNAGPDDLPGATEVSLLFCDLCEFVAYAEEHGDAAAVDAVERFGEVVFDARGERGHVVKGLGDGWMLVFPAPADAVATAERIFTRAAALGIPPIHASVNHGEAVHRDGDWFGREVNLAARLLTWAGEGELLATEQVVTAVPDRAWQRVRRRRVRGVRHPVTAYCVRPVR